MNYRHTTLPVDPGTVIIVVLNVGCVHEKILTPTAYNLPTLEPHCTTLAIPDLFYGHTAGWLIEQHCAERSQNFKPIHVLDDTPIAHNHPTVEPYHTVLDIPGLSYGHAASRLAH